MQSDALRTWLSDNDAWIYFMTSSRSNVKTNSSCAMLVSLFFFCSNFLARPWHVFLRDFVSYHHLQFTKDLGLISRNRITSNGNPESHSAFVFSIGNTSKAVDTKQGQRITTTLAIALHFDVATQQRNNSVVGGLSIRMLSLSSITLKIIQPVIPWGKKRHYLIGILHFILPTATRQHRATKNTKGV